MGLFLTHHLWCRGNEREELYLYPSSGTHRACNGITLPFLLIKFCRVWLTYHCVFMYVFNTSGRQTLHQITPAQGQVCNLKALTCHYICVAVCCCCVCVE